MAAIKMFPAQDGDAFLVINEKTKNAVLIDGGHDDTYRHHIAPALLLLHEEGYRLELVVVTHIDADHIGGLISFFEENGHSSSPSVIPVGSVWHNSLRAMTAPPDAGSDIDIASLTQAIKRINSSRSRKGKGPTEISAKQGSSLAAQLLAGGYHWNEGHGYQCISTAHQPPLTAEGIRAQLLSPHPDRISAICKWWRKQLASLGFDSQGAAGAAFDDAFEFLCAYESLQPKTPQLISQKMPSLEQGYTRDSSPTNGSSLAFVLELDGKRIMMLGDAWAEEVVTTLEEITQDLPEHFDAIKISHHGSIRNTSPKLLGMIDAPIYMISTDGQKHQKHPDIAVLQAIVDRPASYERTLYFNYATEASTLLKQYKSKSGAQFSVVEGANEWISL